MLARSLGALSVQLIQEPRVSSIDLIESESVSHYIRLILTYLIPCCLITKHSIPTHALLSSYPSLQKIFEPLVTCIKRGDPSGFDKALADGHAEFVKRRIFLTLERGRDIATRNLLRKVYMAQGYEELKEGQSEANRIRKSRIPLSHFAVALRMGLGGASRPPLEDTEVESMIANMVYKVRDGSFMFAILHGADTLIGPYERLHFTGTLDGSVEQKGCISRHRGLISNLSDCCIFHDRPDRSPPTRIHLTKISCR